MTLADQDGGIRHLPGGKCATVMDNLVCSASAYNSVFHRRTRAPLLATIGGDPQPFGLMLAGLAELLPLAPDAFDGEGDGIMVDAKIDVSAGVKLRRWEAPCVECRGREMKLVDLYGRVRYAVRIEGISRRGRRVGSGKILGRWRRYWRSRCPPDTGAAMPPNGALDRHNCLGSTEYG
jgi:hypothetical protein